MALEQLGHHDGGADAHFLRLDTGHGKAAEDSQRLEPLFGGQFGAHQHAGGRAVGKLRGIAGGDIAALGDLLAAMMHRLEGRQPFQCRVGAIAFVVIHRDIHQAFGARGLVYFLHLDVEGGDLVLEFSGGLRRGGALLAAKRIFIAGGAADIVALGHDLGGFDHAHPQSGLDRKQMLFGVVVEIDAAQLHQGNGFDTSAHHDIGGFGHDLLCGERDGVEARRAIAVDGDAGGGDRAAGPDQRLARDIVAGGAFGHAAAHDDVFHFARINAGLGDGGLDGMAAHHGAMGLVETAAHRFAHAGAGG